MRTIRIDPRAVDASSIAEAAAVLKAGGLVAFPTETVYGLGANALDAEAVGKIFAAKGRPSTDPVIVHLAGSHDLSRVARDVPPVTEALAARFWPGPLTLILWKQQQVPSDVTAGLATVAVRVPSHPIAHALIRRADVPVAAPSANRFSRPSPTRADHVITDLADAVDIVIDGGPTPIGVESTILDLTVSPPLIRRPGGVSFEEIRDVIHDVRRVEEHLSRAHAQPSPGQLLRHYAPAATATLYVGPLDAVAARVGDELRRAVAAGTRVGVLGPEEDLKALAPRWAAVAATGRVLTRRCGTRRDRDEAARDLFAALRDLDAEGVDVIYAIAPGGDGIDAAIVDRLTRAAEGRVVWVR
jgi:L-threonylcarbamoyladenylate synthase